MRPATRIAIAALFVVIVAAAWYQFRIASADRAAYPGPVPGAPLPTATP